MKRESYDFMDERVFVPLEKGVAEVIFFRPRVVVDMNIVSDVVTAKVNWGSISFEPQRNKPNVASLNLFFEKKQCAAQISPLEFHMIQQKIAEFQLSNVKSFSPKEVAAAHEEEAYG